MTIDPIKPTSNNKLYIILGALFVLIMMSLIVFSPSLLGLLVNTQQTTNQTQEIANDTNQVTKNQTKILVDFIDTYLSNIKNDTTQTKKEILAAKATLASQQETLRAQEESLKNQEEVLRNQQMAVIKQIEILNENKNITANILEISTEHKDAAVSHDLLQKKGDILLKSNANLTELTYELLQKHATSVNTTLGKLEMEEMKQ